MSDNLCDQAKVRTEFFESIMTRNGYEILPGRYGGEYNNDQIALRVDDESSSLMLGLKSLNDDGSGQLDVMSLGANMQLSDEWLKAVEACLAVNVETADWVGKFRQVVSHPLFTRAMVAINHSTGKVSYIPIDFNAEE